MTVPVPAVGDTGTAAWADAVANAINISLAPIFAFKSANTSRASNTTLTADPHLILPMVANAHYELVGFIDYEADVTGDMKFQFTLPASATMNYVFIGYSPSDIFDANAGETSASVSQMGGAGAGAARGALIHGTVTTVGTAGNLGVNWAQNSSVATATIWHAESYLKLVRIS